MRSKGWWFRGTLKFGSSWWVKPNLESFALLFRLKKGVQPSCNCLTCASTCDCFQRLDTVWAENHVLAADEWAHRGKDSSRVYKGVRVCRAHMSLKGAVQYVLKGSVCGWVTPEKVLCYRSHEVTWSFGKSAYKFLWFKQEEQLKLIFFNVFILDYLLFVYIRFSLGF